MDTIVALATPIGNSGVAVIRVSGEGSLGVLKEITKTNEIFEPRKMYLKNVYIDNIIDKCLVVYFKSPFSYTGEDVIEIQSHGGYFLAQKIIEKLMSMGVRLATKGEFSKRAFINGKLSLDQAEGIIDLINAESEMQAKSGSDLLTGKLNEKIKVTQNKILDILAELEAQLDYPEYEFEDSQTSTIRKNIEKVTNELSSLLNSKKNGQIIHNGITVAIVGEPNVGKSSLLNALTNSEKSIVTSVAGTTRDVVEAEYEFNGIVFRLYDTAGIHESTDEVEKIGIDRAKKILDSADIVLRVTTPNIPCKIETTRPSILVVNKCDLNNDEINKDSIIISAKTEKNIDLLKHKIFDICVGEPINTDKVYLTNARHIECMSKAIEYLKRAQTEIQTETLDIVSSTLKQAWLSLGEITGENSTEDVLDRIFSKFCLGK